MRAGWVKSLAFILCLSAWTAAHAWDTRVSGGLGDSDWRSIYELLPEPGNGQVVIHGNEHAEISATALNAIGAGVLLGTDDLPVVTDLNASYFRRDLLFGKQPRQPADAPNDGLERRILPPPAQFSGLPDFSYSLYDWINKNQLCPLPPDTPERAKCHNYNGWIGAALNASHFGTQAALNYKRLHQVALSLADRARGLRLKLRQTPGALQAYRRHLAEAEWMALAYEGVAQHFLADRWSTGHMWERWNAGDYEHLASRDLLVNKLVGYISGMFHGMQTVLHARLSGRSAAHHLWPDPLSSPMVEIERQDGVVERLWNYYVGGESGRITLKSVDPAVFRHAGGGPANPGVGDYGFRDLLDGDFGGREYGFENELPLPLPAQRGEMMSCVQGGWADVIRALGKNPKGGYGILPIPLKEDAPSLAALGERCFDVYVTNRSMMLAWPFSRPSFWSQLGRATLTVLSSDAGVAALEQLGKGNPLSAKAVKALKQTYKTQLAAGRQAARNMVRLSYLAWRQGRRNPGGTDLARGGLGALDFSSGEASKKPEAFVGGENIIEPGDRYKAAAYFPRDDLAGLPSQNDAAGRDKEAVYGFFSRAMADYWGHQLPEILPELRGSSDPWKQALCEYLVDQVYDGTDRDYQGAQKEARTISGHADGDPLPSYLGALGVDLTRAEGVPVQLSPGYVSEPYSKTSDGRTYRSIAAWCARMPVLHLLEAPEYRDRDVVGIIEGAGVFVTLKGADLGNERGKVWVGCGNGEERTELVVRSWADERLEVRLTPLIDPGEHRVCVQRADGYESIGRFILKYQTAPPKVTSVEIWSGGETWYRQPGGIDRPLAGGEYRLSIEFDQPMDPEVPAIVGVSGPGRVKLSGGKWASEQRWTMTLAVPQEADVYLGTRGEHPLQILALSLAGKRLDADPATPGEQPDSRFRFRVGGIEVPAEFAGCYRGSWDDTAALEIGEDGHALAAIDNGRYRIPLVVVNASGKTLRLRHYFDAASFREFHTRKSGSYAVGAAGPLASLEAEKDFEGLLCRIRLDGPDIYCEPEPMSGHFEEQCKTVYEKVCYADGKCTMKPHQECMPPIWVKDQPRSYGINLPASYVEWGLQLITFNKPDTPRYLRTGEGMIQVLKSQDGALFVVKSFEQMQPPEFRPDIVDDQAAFRLKPSWLNGKRSPMVQLDYLLWGRLGLLADEPPRIKALKVIDENGAELSGSIANDSFFELRAEGTSHCPGIVETLPVYVQLPGAEGRSRIVLEETGPDTGIYEGPDVPLLASRPEAMKTGHLLVIAESEISARTGGLGVPGSAGGPQADRAVSQASKGVSLSLKIVPASAAAKKTAGPSVSWRSYALDVARPPSVSLPDIYVVETRYEEFTGRARLSRYRYHVSLARGTRDGVVLWRVRWDTGRTIEETDASDPRSFARTRARAKALRKDGFPLAQLPGRMVAALGGKARPLNSDWGPAAKPAAPKAQSRAPKKTATTAFTYNGPPYRARYLFRMKSGGRTTTQESLVYVMPGRMRSEMKTGPNGLALNTGPVTTIMREDLGVRWTLFERSRTFMESPYRLRVTRTLEGTEKRGGKTLKRYRFTSKGEEGDDISGTMWVDERGIPVRTIQQVKIPDGNVQESETVLEDIRVGPLDETLFELPGDYRPMGYGHDR